MSDPEQDAGHAARTPDCAATHGGGVLVRAGRVEALERGARARQGPIEFSDHAAARAVHDDRADRAIPPHAPAGSRRKLLVVEGVEPGGRGPRAWIGARRPPPAQPSSSAACGFVPAETVSLGPATRPCGPAAPGVFTWTSCWG